MSIAMVWEGAGPRTHSMTWESAARTIYQRFAIAGPWSVWKLRDSPDYGGQWSRCPDAQELPQGAELLPPKKALLLTPDRALELEGLLIPSPLMSDGQTLCVLHSADPRSSLMMVDVPQGALVPVGAVVAKQTDCGIPVGFRE